METLPIPRFFQVCVGMIGMSPKDFWDLSLIEVINTIEGFKIQIVSSRDDYDELKYLSGKDAIDFLQNLTDGKYSAFENDEENN